MSYKTGISWTDTTWNPIRGCSRVSDGCRNCYAEAMAGRIVAMGRGKPTPYDGLVKIMTKEKVLRRDLSDGSVELRKQEQRDSRWTGAVAFDPAVLAEPLRRRKPTTYFVNSMSDLFHDGFTNEQIAAVFGVMAATPQHTFILLTKREQRMRQWFEWVDHESRCRSDWTTPRWQIVESEAIEHIPSLPDTATGRPWPLPNVWLGVSVENQAVADERIPHLLATPAAVRMVSAEPLLGPIDLRDLLWKQSADEYSWPSGASRGVEYEARKGLWVVSGCESGRGARPCEVDWLRSLRDQCVEAKVPFFLKQAKADVFGHTADYPRDTPIQHSMGLCPTIAEGPGSTCKPGGIIDLPYLDGVQWAQRPEVRR